MYQRRVYVIIALGVVLIAGGVRIYLHSRSSLEITPLQIARPIESAPLCPWRAPQEDLMALFPGADHYQTETRILSGRRIELAKRLGRSPSAEENAIHLYQVYSQQQRLGTIMVRRVKGDHGAIELVVGVNTNGVVSGVRLQRLREPQEIAAALTNSAWLAGFQGKTESSSWKIGEDLPDVPTSAFPSSQAIVDGVRSLLVLFDAAEKAATPTAHKHRNS